MQKSKQYYHIQILRALAVLMVIFFHLDKKLLPNGYLGVDIFFVISGFVITNSIINSYNRSTFTFLSFYTNRVKRLFPALFVVILLTFIFALCTFTSPEYYLLKSTKFWYVPLQISNFAFAFYKKSYWDAGDTSIFLHTWSLGVEEQIYLVFPFILLGAYLVYKKQDKPITLFFIFLSLVSIYFFITLKEQLSFYMPHTRAWEFLAGTIVFFIFNNKRNLKFNTNYLLPILVIVLILLAYYGLSINKSILPKSLEHFLLPMFNKHGLDFIFKKFLLIFLIVFLSGLAILLGLSQQIKLNYFTKFFIHLGNLSYSLYLWHFPIIIFYKKLHLTFTGNEISKTDYLIIFIITYILACLSYYLIENPLRKIKTNSKHKQVIVLCASIIIMITLSYFMHTTSNKFMIPYYQKSEGHIFDCCNQVVKNTKLSKHKYNFGFRSSALYIGDSHGEEKNIAMLNWAKRNHTNIYIATQGACASIKFLNDKTNTNCFKLKQFANIALLTDNSINTVIITYVSTKSFKKNLDYLISIKPNLHYIVLGDQPALIYSAYNCIRDFTIIGHIKYLNNIMKKHKCLILDFKAANKQNKELVTLINNYKKKNINISFIPMSQYYKAPEYQGRILFRNDHLNPYGVDYITNHPKAFHFKINN